MSDIDRERREMRRVLRPDGLNPDRSLKLTRRLFVHKAVVFGGVTTTGAAAAAITGWFPMINTMTVANAAEAPFSFAWISDTHLYPKEVNSRFVDKITRAAKDVQAMRPPADFLIFGGDIAQLGRANELDLGNQILQEVTVKKYFIPGEHDWYFDLGKKWRSLYGDPNWTFDHKGVRFIALDTISRAPDYWSATKMSPEDHMATLDGNVAGPWAGVGDDQIAWMQKVLSDWPKDSPVIIFSHNPLYDYYPPWNFWVRDWQQVNEVLRPYTKVTNIHGHTHQVLYNEIGSMRSFGMLATSWPWPYPPTGVPKLTREMIRADPGDPFDGVGWGKWTGVSADPGNTFQGEYVMWDRKVVYAESGPDTSASHPEVLHARIADRGWFYPD
jgi:Icc protein